MMVSVSPPTIVFPPVAKVKLLHLGPTHMHREFRPRTNATDVINEVSILNNYKISTIAPCHTVSWDSVEDSNFISRALD